MHRRRPTTTASPRISTVPKLFPPPARQSPKPGARIAPPKPALRPPKTSPPPTRQVARIIDEGESTLLDLIDNLLGKGVMLNAEVVLALANVDLVYVRLSALLCAADRVLQPPMSRSAGRKGQ
jgi:gas vesicle protein GvpA/GvpJ/GvpM family